MKKNKSRRKVYETVSLEDATKVYSCLYPGCQKSFKWRSSMAYHAKTHYEKVDKAHLEYLDLQFANNEVKKSSSSLDSIIGCLEAKDLPVPSNSENILKKSDSLQRLEEGKRNFIDRDLSMEYVEHSTTEDSHSLYHSNVRNLSDLGINDFPYQTNKLRNRASSDMTLSVGTTSADSSYFDIEQAKAQMYYLMNLSKDT